MRASTVATQVPRNLNRRQALPLAVRRYAEYAHHTPVEGDFVTHDGFQLGRWADRQRIARAIRTLPPQRERELDAVGFDWKVTQVPQTDGKRLNMLTEIAAYRELNGTAQIPVNYTTDDGQRLGEWLYRQIKRWRTGVLPADEQAVLELLGVNPGARRRGPAPTTTSG